MFRSGNTLRNILAKFVQENYDTTLFYEVYVRHKAVSRAIVISTWVLLPFLFN